MPIHLFRSKDPFGEMKSESDPIILLIPIGSDQSLKSTYTLLTFELCMIVRGVKWQLLRTIVHRAAPGSEAITFSCFSRLPKQRRLHKPCTTIIEY